MEEEDRREILRQINEMLAKTSDQDIMEVYWYLKVYIR